MHARRLTVVIFNSNSNRYFKFSIAYGKSVGLYKCIYTKVSAEKSRQILRFIAYICIHAVCTQARR